MALLAASSPLASALCTYPLDATPAQYSAAGVTPFPYVNFQSVEYTSVLTTNGNTINYQAFSDTGFDALVQTAATGVPGGDVVLPTSGIVAFEMRVDRFPATTAPNVNNYLNMNTRQVGYTVNGSDRGYLRNGDGSAFQLPAPPTSAVPAATPARRCPTASPSPARARRSACSDSRRCRCRARFAEGRLAIRNPAKAGFFYCVRRCGPCCARARSLQLAEGQGQRGGGMGGLRLLMP